MKLPVLLAGLLLATALPVTAHHPGERIDEVTAEQEPAFEPTDSWQVLSWQVSGSDGEGLDLDELTDQIIVVSFAPTDCQPSCADQQAVLRMVQASVNVTPMRELVQFVTISDTRSTNPDRQAENWRPVFLDDSALEKAIEEFAALSERESGQPMIHIIDRGGRHSGIFHGSDFLRSNLVLYINGLSNNRPVEPDFLDRMKARF